MQSPISATYLEYTATCAGCSHCRDLSGTNNATDPPALTATRQAAIAAMRAWMSGSAPAAAAAAAPLSTGAIAGIAIGGVLGVAAGAAAFVYVSRSVRGGVESEHKLLAGG